MKPDIKDRIIRDFGLQEATALALIEAFESEEKLSPRISRCIVHLAHGDLSKLERYIQNAKYDWRDVILWAEVVPFEYNRPFNYSSLGLVSRLRFDTRRKIHTFFKRILEFKLRITPLLVLSLVAMGFGLHYFLSKQHDEEGWVRFGAIILITCGGGGIFVYFVLRFVLRLKYLAQVLTELALLVLFVLYILTRA